MGAVLLVQVDGVLAQTLPRRLLNSAGFTFEEVAPTSVPARLTRGQPAVDALIVGPAADQPLRIAQQVGTANRSVSVLILSTPDQQPTLQRALQFTPLLGEDVSCAAAADGAAVVTIVEEALGRIRQRRDYQRTIAAINSRLAEAPPPPAVGPYLDRLLDSAPIGIVTVDRAGRVVTWNPKAGELLERGERGALGLSLREFFPTAAGDEIGALLTHCRNNEGPCGPVILERARDLDQPQWIEASGVSLPGETEEPPTLVLLQDVTERVKAERERTAALVREQAAVRTRDEFLSVAAHELKTPVTSLLLAAQLLTRRLSQGTPRSDDLRQPVSMISQQARKLARMIDQLLDISRLEAGRMALECAPVDLAQLIEETVAGPRLRSGRHQIVVEAPEPVQAIVDPLRIEQVLANLLDNAIKYSPDGGRITVALIPPTGGLVRISVRDPGLGIAPEHRAGIFDRFYQAHSASRQSGMGLGLYISQQIAELHGGRITVEFPPEGGSIFHLHLPAGL